MAQPHVLRSRSVALLASATLFLPMACHRSAPVTDASLTSAVQNRLSSDTVLASEPIQATVQGAVVTLNGTVGSDAARELASRDASQVDGVRTVVNNLTVQTAAAEAAPAMTPMPEPVAAPTTAAPSAADRRREARERERERAEQARAARAAKQAKAAAATRAAAPVTRADAAEPAAATPPPIQTPVAPPAPVTRMITLPAGVILPVRLTQTLDSATAQQGQSFSGTLATDVTADGVTVLRAGSNVSGQVTAVQEAAHFKGNSLLTISLTGIRRHGEQLPIQTDSYSAQGKGRGTNTAEKVGGGAAVGAILGGIFGGGRGAAIGAAAGGGTGAGINGLTRGQQVQIPSESVVRFRLASPVSVRVTNDASNSGETAPEGNRRPLP